MLKNQGATCYMNSLLQSLFCARYFRKVHRTICLWFGRLDLFRLYTNYPPNALTQQKAYPWPCNVYSTTSRLQISLLVSHFWPRRGSPTHDYEIIGAAELTKSFGWKSLDSFLQHDVQEFNRVLQDQLETKMKVRFVRLICASMHGGSVILGHCCRRGNPEVVRRQDEDLYQVR